MSRSIITLENIGKIYYVYRGWSRKKIEALKNVSMEVFQGDIFGVIGPNGAGKTTLTKILLGLVRKTQGKAVILGYPAGHIQVRRQTGFLPESYQIPFYHTPWTACWFYGRLSGLSREDLKRRIPEVLKLTGLTEWTNVKVKAFSKGMRQRLGLALALVHQPSLLILDEPTDGIDPVGRVEIRHILKQLQERGVTIFLNSHLLHETELVCNRVAILHQGEVRLVGSVKDLQQIHAQKRIFEVQASLLDLQKLLPDMVILESSGPQSSIVFEKRVEDIAELNHIIDLLRENRIPILSIRSPQQTLEDAFLQIIAKEQV